VTGRRALVWLVVAGLLAATAIATARAVRVETREAEDENQALARQAATLAEQDVALLAAGVRGGAAVLDPTGEIDRDRFELFAADVLRRSPFPALAFERLIRNEERAAVEAQIGRSLTELAADGFRRTDKRPLYAPIVAIYPTDAERRPLLGFDVLSERVRRAAALEARATGEPRVTRPLPQASSGRTGVTVFSPAYAERDGSRGAALGFFSAGIVGSSITRQIARRLDGAGPVQLMDGSAVLAGPRVMPEGSRSETVPVLGRTWTVSVAPAVETDLTPAFGFALGGLALTLLAAAIFWAAGRRERELQARQGLAELQAQRESLLSRIADAVEREIEVDARLGSLAKVLVPAVGDYSAIHVVTPERSVRRAGVASVAPEVERVLRSLGTPPATSPVRAAISSRQPVLYTRVSESREGRVGQPEGVPWPPRNEAELRDNIRSSMIVPLVARDRVLGAISLAILRGTDRPAYTREDLAFVGEVAAHSAVALDNARLYEQQRDIAGILQSALLPPSLPTIEGVEVAARHRPGLDGAEVGGDFYDLFAAGSGWVAVVGDVCGKGPGAAALTALVRHTLRATADGGPELAVARVHEAIRASGEHTYCTLCCVELDTSGPGLGARITTAGHPEARILHADGTVRRLNVTGPLVGAFDSATFESESVRLESGDLLFMCSDGVPEARRNGDVFGDERLEALLGSMAGLPPAELIEKLEAEVVEFVAGRQRDDLALFALRVR
jgi:serine phosphatase RsbU (regulator of sigma subunit)/CHASE1-domain containing sensor protein